PLRQVLMIDLEDDLKAVIRFGEDVGRGVLTKDRLGRGALETHLPDYFGQRVLRVQRRRCERLDARRRQASRPEEFLPPGKNLQKVFLLHALNAGRSAEQEGLGITSCNPFHVERRVCRLIAGEESSDVRVLVAHPWQDSTFSGLATRVQPASPATTRIRPAWSAC